MSDHDCVDPVARAAVRSSRDEHAESLGRVMGEIGAVREDVRVIGEFLGIEAFKRRQGLNGQVNGIYRKKEPSLADLVEEATTSPGTTTSNPVKAAVERWTGKAVWKGISMAGLAGLGVVAHWLWTVIWAALHAGH
ncbi:MAG TPA: hypothetical protein VKU44_00785 [Terriglobia bacterium]|nr:hypothetical protein [Terriglobia bacterium]